jgi:hypothetical protein
MSSTLTPKRESGRQGIRLKAWFPRIEANVWTGHILQEEESNGISKE